MKLPFFKHQQETVLRDRLSFSSYLLDSIEYPVVALDCNENIFFLNSKIQLLLDKKDTQIFGKGFEDVFKLFSENGSKMEIPFDRILVKGEAEEFNGISLKISAEKTLVVDIMVSPFKKMTSKIIDSVLIIGDVTAYSMTREEKDAVLGTLIKLMKESSEDN